MDMQKHSFYVFLKKIAKLQLDLKQKSVEGHQRWCESEPGSKESYIYFVKFKIYEEISASLCKMISALYFSDIEKTDGCYNGSGEDDED